MEPDNLEVSDADVAAIAARLAAESKERAEAQARWYKDPGNAEDLAGECCGDHSIRLLDWAMYWYRRSNP
jgi:hypothetical protein